MSDRTPKYTLTDFLCACKNCSKVKVSRGAQISAKSDFNLQTEEDTLDWIAEGGLEDLRFIKSDPWVNNNDPLYVIWVDVYYFFSGPDYGYLAFVYSPTTEMWLIKSLKLNGRPAPRR